MDINEKINYRANAFWHLEFNQYMQLIKLNKLILAPYYNDRLLKQAEYVADAENFKSVFGCYRYEYENNIKP